MRLWLLSAFVAAVVALEFDHDANFNRAKSVLKSWDHNLPVQYIDEENHRHEETHIRSKRSVMSLTTSSNSLGLDKSCTTPGYTGEFCEFPICGVNNPGAPDSPAEDGEGATIDMTNLANCSQEYVVLVDDTMYAIRFELESDQPLNPNFDLYDSAGNLMLPDQDTLSRTQTSIIAFYMTLAPGRYKLVPSADLPKTYCSLAIRAKTPLTIVGGFVEEAEDAARSDFPIGFTFKDQASTAVFHANRMRSPAKLITAAFTGPDNSIFRPRLLNTRYNCSYEYFYETFTCRTTGAYLYHLEGVTFEGYNFRRVYSFYCMPPRPTEPTVTTSPTTPAPVTGCKNQGFMITNLDGSQYCYCHGLWSGPDCSQIICMNGGEVDDNNKCRCHTGFEGDHCQDMVCTDNKGLEFDAVHPTLTLVLRVRSSMNDANQQIKQATQDLIDRLQFDPEYLTSYILVLFNNGEIILNQRYESSVDLINALNSTAATSTSTDGDCHDSVFTALANALTHYPNNKSPVYIVTDAPPSDMEVGETVFHMDSFWRAPLNFIFIQPEVACTLTPEDAGYRKMDDVAKRSGGQTFFLKNSSNTYNFAYTHMSNTVYRSQLLISNDVQVCQSQNGFQGITVDSAFQTLTIVGSGNHLKLVVTQPEGNNFTSYVAEYDDEGNYIWTIKGLHSGLWSFQVFTNHQGSPCSFKVFQKMYNNMAALTEPQYDLFWAFSPNIAMNGYETQPIYGMEQAIVAKLTNYPFLYPQYVTASLNIYASRNGIQAEVYAANGIWRDGCDYNFYFPPFVCTKPNEILYFNFYARDQTGMAIQRAGTMYCSEISPTLQPPSDCQNGGVSTPQNTSCYCPLGYTGNRCEQISCFNGGTALGNKCLCIQGWTGSFCEFPRCTQKGESPEPMMKYVDMVFAVEITQIGAGQIGWLQKYFSTLLRDIIFQDTRWIRRFVLTGFNSTWADVLAVAPATNPQPVIDALQNVVDSFSTNYKDLDPGCNVQVWQAFDVAILKRDTVPGSFMELFVSSTPDNSDEVGWQELYDFQRSMNLHINVYLGTSATNKQDPAGFFCNAHAEDFFWLNAITGSAAGAIYTNQQGNTADLLKTIPNQYYSAINYLRYEMDCTATEQFYFPIDSYTQTIQLEVYGQNPVVNVVDPTGKSYGNLKPFVQDTMSGLSIYDIRKGCDDGWEDHGSYCYKFHQEEKFNWADAQSFCHSAGAQLADDLTDDSHAFLKSIAGAYQFWIGLFNNGSQWAWDRPTGVEPLPLKQDHTYWADGTLPTDPAKQCVFWNGYNFRDDSWTAEYCGVEKWFLCQKHRYDSDFRPENLEYDDLPDGKWYATVKTTPATTNPTKACGLTVRVQSELQIFTGYSQEVYQDTPDIDPYRDSNRNRLITYIHSQDNDYRNPILQMAYIQDAYNATFYNAARYQERVSCAYPWVSQTFDCPNAQNDGNEFMVTHSGEDSFGNMFQRVTFGHCSRQPLTCGNGGYRWNGKCICDEYWQGSLCTIPVCVNNGTLSDDNRRCQCPAGYTGFNCQYATCWYPRSSTFYNNDKSLVIVIENTIQNQKAIKNLASGFNNITAALDPTYFYNFVTVVFDSTGVTNIMTTENAADVPGQLNLLTQTDQGSCSMPLYTAIYGILNDSEKLMETQWPNSEMILITSAGASDEDKRRQDIMALSDHRLKFYYFFMSSDTCGPQPTDGSLTNLVRTAYTTNGDVAFMSSDDLVAYLTAYLPTRYGANTLSNPTVHLDYTCPGNKWRVQVDSNTTSVYITTTAAIGDLAGNDPKGDIITPKLVYSTGNSKIHLIDTDRLPGIYTFSFTSYGGCYASIYGGLGGAQVTALYAPTNSSFDPSGINQDGYAHSPTAFIQNVLTAHLVGAQGHRGKLQYVEIFDVDTQQIILRSELYRRDGPFGQVQGATCQFEYVSDPFTCDTDILAVYVYGMDENNIEFRRQSVAYCMNSSMDTGTTVSKPQTSTTTSLSTSITTTTTTTTTGPTTTTTVSTPPPTTSYGNRNLVFDIAVLIDVSKSATNLYDQMSKFIQTMMLSYTIGSNVNIAILPVFGTNFGELNIGSLKYITSQQMLVNQLNELKTQWNDFDDEGQYLQAALDSASNSNFITPDNGYRPIKNHVLLYVTATTSFSDNPNSSNILNNNIYGIITIGYGDGATDQQKLSNVAGGDNCAFVAADVHQLNTDTLNGVTNLIWNADSNGGLYCGNSINK